MRSTLLSHSEWAERASSGLERRPRQNGAGAAPQWNRSGDHHEGKTSIFTPQKVTDRSVAPPRYSPTYRRCKTIMCWFTHGLKVQCVGFRRETEYNTCSCVFISVSSPETQPKLVFVTLE